MKKIKIARAIAEFAVLSEFSIASGMAAALGDFIPFSDSAEPFQSSGGNSLSIPNGGQVVERKKHRKKKSANRYFAGARGLSLRFSALSNVGDVKQPAAVKETKAGKRKAHKGNAERAAQRKGKAKRLAAKSPPKQTPKLSKKQKKAAKAAAAQQRTVDEVVVLPIEQHLAAGTAIQQAISFVGADLQRPAPLFIQDLPTSTSSTSIFDVYAKNEAATESQVPVGVPALIRQHLRPIVIDGPNIALG